MKISRLTTGIGAAVLLAIAFTARAGGLSPALQHLQVTYSRTPGALAKGLAKPAAVRPAVFGPRVNAADAVQVYIHYRPGQQPAQAALEKLGATQIRAALGLVQAWVPITLLDQLAALGGVTRVGLPAYAIVRVPNVPQPRADTCSAVQSGLAIDQEGIAAENIGPLQSAGINGSGVRVGIISLGVDCLHSSVSAGYLPSSIQLYAPAKSTGAEGTAMLEEVHAAAPAATLGFCSAQTSVDFITCYKDFASWGAKVIADDLGFPTTFFFNDPKALAFISGIQQFAQKNSDISLVTAAGNDRQDYYQGDYTASTSPPSITLTPAPSTSVIEPGGVIKARTYLSAMDFGGNPSQTVSTFNVSSGYTAYFLLTWDDPLNGPYDDLDLYLVNSSGNIVDASTYDQASDANYAPSSVSWNPPEEFVQYTNSSGSPQTLKLVVMCYVCDKPKSPQKLLVKLAGTLDGAGSFAQTANGGVYGQAAMKEEISAAAAHVNDASGSSATVDSFSQAGPYTQGDWLNGTTTVPKPDITGIDAVTVSGAGGFSTPFYGTSAASPNVASVIALARSAFPYGRSDATGWKELVMSNANSSALTNYTLDTAGTGLVDAQAALAGVDGVMTPAITAPSGSPVKANPNTDVAFQGDCNYSGNSPLSYLWAFGGDSGIPNSTKLPPDPVQYANGGIYTVNFTCSDQYQSKTATKTVAVQAAATATGQSLSTAYEIGKAGQFTGTGIGGEQVKYEVVQQPAHGMLQTNGSAVFVYTPDNGYSGTDSFTFDIDNGVIKSNTATVSVTVGAAPPPPPSAGGGAFGLGGLAALFGLAGLLALRRRH